MVRNGVCEIMELVVGRRKLESGEFCSYWDRGSTGIGIGTITFAAFLDWVFY